VRFGPSSQRSPIVGRNTVMGMYDRRLYRDWAAWLTLFWLVVTPLALGTGKKADSGWPRWVDVVVDTLVFVILFGMAPALLRRAWRAYRASRRRAKGQGATQPYDQSDFMAANYTPVSHPIWPAPGPPPATSETPSPPLAPSMMPPQMPWPAEPGPSPAASETPPSRLAPTPPPRERSSAAPDPFIAMRVAPASPQPSPPGPPPETVTPSSVTAAERPLSRQPATLSLVRGSDPAESEILNSARFGFPFPIAYAARRVQGAATPKDRYDAVLEAGEAIAGNDWAGCGGGVR
jgi:hypothetical protein